MSKSKRAAQGSVSPAPRQEKRLFARPEGGLRTGWLLAVSLLGYAILALAVRSGLSAALARLIGAWGLDADNARLAPAWARFVYAWGGSLVTLLVSVAVLALCRPMRRLWRLEEDRRRPSLKALGRAALAGLCTAALVAALGLLPDSTRLQWPLNAPRLAWRVIPLCILNFIAILAGEGFGKRVLYDGLRVRWSAGRAVAVACGMFFLSNGCFAGNAISAVNVLLLGLLSCLLFDRWGLWASTGFIWGWSVINTFLLGFGGGESAVYRLYGVSETLMTGGDAGPMCGLWATLALAEANGMCLWRNKRTSDGEK